MKNIMKALTLLLVTGLLAMPACDNRRQPGQQPNTPQLNAQDGGIAEGTINGGGGRGMLCTKNGKETLEVLDLYEAKAAGLTLLPEPRSEAEALDLAIDLLAKQIWNPDTIPMDQFRASLKKIIKEKWLDQVNFLPKGKTLRLVNDSHEIVTEEGCKPVQIAIYLEARISIVKKYWDKLSFLNRAALYMHELVYSLERQNGQKNSISTRILVGQMFSTKGARAKFDGVPKDSKKLVSCFLKDGDKDFGYFFAHETKENDYEGTEIVFNYLLSQTTLFRTSAFFYGLTLEKLYQPNISSGYSSVVQVDSLAQQSAIDLRLQKENSRVVLSNQKREVIGNYELQCRRDNPDADPVTKIEPDEPKKIEPPSIPSSVELKSRYEGHGTYETTATYSFRKMTHDVEKTRNNWDILLEARSDMKEDLFRVNTVVDDQSFLFALKSGAKGCHDADPCEIREKLNPAGEPGKYDNIPVVKGQCYLEVSEDRDGKIKVMFEVQEHEKSVSAVISNIQVLTDEVGNTCQK